MTYLEFHLVFTIPATALLAFLAHRAARAGERVAGFLHPSSRFALLAIAVHVVVAFVYTTPWDNYLVYREVWGYPPGAVLFTIGYVPVEEYFFFVIQTVMTGLFLFMLARHLRAPPERTVAGASLVRFLGAAALLFVAAGGVLALSTEAGTYLGLILVWAVPVIAFQWWFGGDLIARRPGFVALAIMLPTVYLWIADRIAIGIGIWWISPELTVGLRPFGLPVEEALFFLVTNVLIVFGLTLALHPESLPRLRGLLRKGRVPWRAALVLWAFSMIPTPLVPDAFPLLAYVSTTLLAFGVLGFLWERYGPRALVLFGAAFAFGVVVEWIGHTTGLPFGRYEYTAPGPSLLGVPLLVPLGWFAFTIIVLNVVPRSSARFLAPLALVAWDLGLDPLMVHKGFWTFDAGGAYYGIPVTNFLGWYVAGFLLVWTLVRIEPSLSALGSPELRIVYVAQAFLVSVGLAFFGMPGAGVATVVAMTLVAYPAWRPYVGRYAFGGGD